MLREEWEKGTMEKGLQCVVSHSLPQTDRHTHTH